MDAKKVVALLIALVLVAWFFTSSMSPLLRTFLAVTGIGLWLKFFLRPRQVVTYEDHQLPDEIVFRGGKITYKPSDSSFRLRLWSTEWTDLSGKTFTGKFDREFSLATSYPWMLLDKVYESKTYQESVGGTFVAGGQLGSFTGFGAKKTVDVRTGDLELTIAIRSLQHLDPIYVKSRRHLKDPWHTNGQGLSDLRHMVAKLKRLHDEHVKTAKETVKAGHRLGHDMEFKKLCAQYFLKGEFSDWTFWDDQIVLMLIADRDGKCLIKNRDQLWSGSLVGAAAYIKTETSPNGSQTEYLEVSVRDSEYEARHLAVRRFSIYFSRDKMLDWRDRIGLLANPFPLVDDAI